MYVLLADDQKSVRTALKLLLQQQDIVKHIEATANAGDLLTRVATGCPDLLLLDWGLPGMDGTTLVITIKKLCPTISVIAISGQPESKAPALAAGCSAFVSKTSPPETLIRAIRANSNHEEEFHVQ